MSEEMPETGKRRRPQSRGVSRSCGGEFAASTMPRHLQSCKSFPAAPVRRGATTPAPEPPFHIVVQGRYEPGYRIHLTVGFPTRLETLDVYLRRLWLECCGHVSSFRVGSTCYSSFPDEDFGDQSMHAYLRRAIPPGGSATYQYDFGSTTELAIRNLGRLPCGVGTAAIQLMARNPGLLSLLDQRGTFLV